MEGGGRSLGECVEGGGRSLGEGVWKEVGGHWVRGCGRRWEVRGCGRRWEVIG